MNFYRIVIALLFVCPLYTYGQDTIYFNQDWNVVDKLTATQYTTILVLPDNPNRFLVRDFTKEGILLADYQYKGLLKSIDWSGIYKNGFHFFAIEEGGSCEYFPSGNKKKELTHKDGIQKGLISVWNEKGDKIRSYYADNNIANGSYSEYFKNGNLNFTVHFKNDTLQGNAIYYHENGEISKLGKFNKGVKAGKWQYISEDGRPIAEEVYKSTFFIDGPNINISFPDGKWYLSERYKEDGRLNFIFSRLSFTDSQNVEDVPSCLITLEAVNRDIQLIDYSSQRRRRLSIDVQRVIPAERNWFTLDQTIGYIGGSGNDNEEERIIYLVHSIQNNVGVEMILDCKKDNYNSIKEVSKLVFLTAWQLANQN